MSSVTAPARVFCTAVLGLLLCASSLLVLFPGPLSSASASAPPPSTSNCQNTTPLGMPGSWGCSFDDEFNGTSLDTTKWTPQLTADSGYTTGTTSGWPCYVDSPNTISESGGYLHLSVVQEPAPVSCAGYSTPFEAGMVTTDQLFDQTYGAYEVNAELPASVVNGLQETFWLYPQTTTYGAWPQSGEIDFAEFFSEYPTLDVPSIHYTEGASGDPDVTAYDCAINQGDFNTYGIDWQPGSLTIYLNGNVCLVDHPNPAAPLTSPEPFNDPFFLALTQALGSGTDAYVSGSTQLPATTLVDWVRAWTASTSTDTYGVTYEGNGATGGNVPIDANSYAAGAAVSVLGNTGNLVNTGYSFDDWNTAANGSGTSYAPGATFSMPAAGVTLYAVWTPDPDTYGVTYEGNGATGGNVPVDANSYAAGAAVSVLGNTGNLVNTGYSFDDWNTAANGSGTSYAPGATFSMPAAGVTLYAIWTPDPDTYGVTYEGNGATGGNVPVDANSYAAGAAVSVLGNTGSLVNTGYSFDDWNTAANGSGTSYAPGATFSMPAAGVTLYAIWTPDPDTYGVTYEGNGATGGIVPIDANSYAAGAAVSVLGNTGNLVNTGYSFDDWNTAANGSGTSYAPGATFSMPAAGVTLYAIWTPSTPTEKTTTTLSLPKPAVSYGAETSETFTVTVTGQSGDGYPEGTLTFYNASTKLCSQTVVEQSPDSVTATCSLTATELPVGSYGDVFATYAPSTTSSSNTGYAYTASTSTPATRLSITKDRTTTKVSESPNNVARGEESEAVFTVTVATHSGESVPNGEKVTLKVGSATCTLTLNSGTGTCVIANSALPRGSYSVSATYGGDVNLGGSSGTGATKLTVKN